MRNFSEKLADQWQDAVNFLLGVWLVVSPWFLLSAPEWTVAATNMLVVGVIIAVAAAASFVAFHTWEEWVNVVLGAWLIISPWVLGFSGTTAAMWNHVVVGALVLVLALWSAFAEHKSGPLVTKG